MDDPTVMSRTVESLSHRVAEDIGVRTVGRSDCLKIVTEANLGARLCGRARFAWTPGVEGSCVGGIKRVWREPIFLAEDAKRRVATLEKRFLRKTVWCR